MKLVLEEKLENSNQEVRQLVQDMKSVQEDLEICIVEKKYDQEMLKNLDSIIL
jgi:hypothetical protein